MIPNSIFRFLTSLDRFIDQRKPFTKYEDYGKQLEEKVGELDQEWGKFGAEMEKVMNELENKIE